MKTDQANPWEPASELRVVVQPPYGCHGPVLIKRDAVNDREVFTCRVLTGTDRSEAFARRLLLCLQACEGVADEYLSCMTETGGVRQMVRDFAELMAEVGA